MCVCVNKFVTECSREQDWDTATTPHQSQQLAERSPDHQSIPQSPQSTKDLRLLSLGQPHIKDRGREPWNRSPQWARSALLQRARTDLSQARHPRNYCTTAPGGLEGEATMKLPHP